jgi:hypothetical protein
MGEPVVAAVMTCPAVAVTSNTKFKYVVNALLAGDAYAVPVVDTEARPLGRSPRRTCWPNSSFTAEPTPYQSSAARLPAAAGARPRR